MKSVLVYGSSGHAKVILDIFNRCNHPVVGLIDDDPASWGILVQGHRVLGGFELFERQEYLSNSVLLAIGDNGARARVAQRLEQLGVEFASAIHPSASVASEVSVASGAAIMAQVAVNSGAAIGKHVILNTGCTVDHDCVIEDFAHVSPGAHLAGNVTVGQGVHLGVGVNVIPGISIGAKTVVGAGATVISDLPPSVTAVGVPARVIKTAKDVESERKT